MSGQVRDKYVHLFEMPLTKEEKDCGWEVAISDRNEISVTRDHSAFLCTWFLMKSVVPMGEPNTQQPSLTTVIPVCFKMSEAELMRSFLTRRIGLTGIREMTIFWAFS